MEYTCYYSEWNDVRDDYKASLNPEEFLDCEDEDALYEAIRETMWDQSPVDTEYLECYDTDLSVPEEFIAEWKQLKGIEE